MLIIISIDTLIISVGVNESSFKLINGTSNNMFEDLHSTSWNLQSAIIYNAKLTRGYQVSTSELHKNVNNKKLKPKINSKLDFQSRKQFFCISAFFSPQDLLLRVLNHQPQSRSAECFLMYSLERSQVNY